ncbi:MAG: hypothetical protein RL223_4876 [Pseudomonadota bacterium]
MLLLAAALGTAQARPAAERNPARADAGRAKVVKTAKTVRATKIAQAAKPEPRAGRQARAERPARQAVAAKALDKAAQVRAGSRSRAGQATALRRAAVAAPVVAAAAVAVPTLSFGQQQGLHNNPDPLDLRSSVALVIDQDTNEVLFAKNANAVLPIASITKLMTALVVTEARQSLDEVLTITSDDIDTEKNSRSRLNPGTQLSRGEMLHLALMSSENRAANALGRHYPGGLSAFVQAMNRKAAQLGMRDTHYVEPTGLSSRNQSSARDLAVLVKDRPSHDGLPQHQRPGAQPELGDRSAEDRLHLRGGSLPGHAGAARRPQADHAARRPQADHGAAGFRREVLPHGRRRAHPPLAGRQFRQPQRRRATARRLMLLAGGGGTWRAACRPVQRAPWRGTAPCR